MTARRSLARLIRQVVRPLDSPWFVTVSVTANPSPRGSTASTVAGNGPRPETAKRGDDREYGERQGDRDEHRPVNLACGRHRAARAGCNVRTGQRRARPARRNGRTDGSARRGRGRARPGRTWSGSRADGATDAHGAPGYQRATASTSASTSSVVRARTIAPSAPAARQRSQVVARRRSPRASRDDAAVARATRPGTPTSTVWSSRRRPAASSASR